MAVSCFVANWKMNKTRGEAQAYLSVLRGRLKASGLDKQTEVVIAPPFTALAVLSENVAGVDARVDGWVWAAQNVSDEDDGAHTGEVSARMLCDAGCRYVIVGHSERRARFGEDGVQIARKVGAACRSGLIPILCVGETAQERAAGMGPAVVMRQVGEAALAGTAEIVVAYEPVWAIGSGVTPCPEEVEAMHRHIRETLASSDRPARVLYGGSVHSENVADFMRMTGVDGVLVGGASLSADTFFDLIVRGLHAKRQIR